MLDLSEFDNGEFAPDRNLGIYKAVNNDQFPTAQYFLNTYGDYPRFHYRAKPTIYKDSDECITNFFNKIGYNPTLIARQWNETAVDIRLFSITENDGGHALIEFLFTDYYDSSDDIGDDAVLDERDNNTPTLYITIFTNHIGLYSKLISTIQSTHIKREKSGYINMLIKRAGGYDLYPMKLKKGLDINISANYNDDFEPVHKVIFDSLNEETRAGLVLLHGIPGSGKSYYLRYLANTVKKNMIYIPPYLTEFLTTPEMLPFLMSYPDSILLIEDAEKVITDREQTASSGVSNILNITDGILSDLLKMQIVATFNMDKDNIDKALLRKGRLIAEYEFGKLSVEKSNAKLKELGFDYTTDVPLSLTEIYNIEDMSFGDMVMNNKKPIGFS
jgi:hypothetical protein